MQGQVAGESNRKKGKNEEESGYDIVSTVHTCTVNAKVVGSVAGRRAG